MPTIRADPRIANFALAPTRPRLCRASGGGIACSCSSSSCSRDTTQDLLESALRDLSQHAPATRRIRTDEAI